MILIVESGSTKADWIVVDSDGVKCEFKTKGWNIMLLKESEMQARLNVLTQLVPFVNSISFVYFYTPGLAIQESVFSLQRVLQALFINALISIESDLLAAARSVYSGSPLFVSILGTGSNTAFYDGEVLQQTSPSLGYVLGDEGSGAALGKDLLKAYLYQSLPKDLYLSFSKSHSISKENVLKAVYTQDAPNRFLASYVPFLVAHKNHDFVKDLVINQFDLYIKTHLKSNPIISDYPIAFVGSVAFLFKDILSSLIIINHQLTVFCFSQSPIKGLLQYHVQEFNA